MGLFGLMLNKGEDMNREMKIAEKILKADAESSNVLYRQMDRDEQDQLRKDLDDHLVEDAVGFVGEALKLSQRGHDSLYHSLGGRRSNPPVAVMDLMRFFQLMKIKLTGLMSDLNKHQVGKTAGMKTAGGKWSWEIKHVDGIGVLLQIIWDSEARYIQWSNMAFLIKALTAKATVDLHDLVKEGLPINMSKVDVVDPEIVSEDSRVKIFANVKVQWGLLNAPVVWDDVEEAMMEAGLK